MATLIDTLTDALFRLGALQRGAVPSAHQADVGIRAFNNLLDSLPNRGVGEVLQSVRADSDMTICRPSIVHVIASSGLTLTLPKNPADGFRVQIVDVGTNFATNPVTVERNGWLIAGAASSATLNTNGQNVEYFFRAELGDWKALTRPLAQGADIPYPAAHDGDFTALLVVEIADLIGKDLTGSLVARAESALTRLQGQYKPDLRASFDHALYYTPSHIPLQRGKEASD